MKIMADTNILFSALLFPNSRPAKALFQIAERHNLVLCDYIISEIIAGVDIIISGDGHFLKPEMEHPKTMSVAKFLDDPA